MRKCFTALALFLAFASNAQEPDIYSVFSDIKAGLLHNPSPRFYLDCAALGEFKLQGDALFVQRDSMRKYLDSAEIAFLYTFINVPLYPYEGWRTIDTTFIYRPLTAFDAGLLTGAIPATDSIRTRIFLSNAYAPPRTGEAGEKERADQAEKLKRVAASWDNEIYSFSSPLFNPGKTLFLLSVSCMKGMFERSAKTLLYKQVNGRWVQIMWLSAYTS